jgi:Flp pilus assembly protein TadG
MRAVRRRNKWPEHGQSTLELTGILIVLLIFLLGLVEVALVLRAKLVLTNANREAARYASRGIYTDEEIAERALASFAGQLPADASGKDGPPNTTIIITRFRIPATATAKDQPIRYPAYVTGTFSYVTAQGEITKTATQLPKNQLQLLISENAEFFTDHDVVYVEMFYNHHQMLNAPIVSAFIPTSTVLYAETSMRITAPQVKE